MRYALIGCGRISVNHLSAALDNKLEVIALCDTDRQTMTDKAERFGLSDTAALYTDYHEMLRQKKPEVVAVCTESGKHARITLDCIAAGTHVIVEKPIALSLNDADAIIAAADKAGVKVCACHQNRFNRSIQKMRSALEEGRFGTLFHGAAHVRWNRDDQYYRQASWRGTWAQDGGVLMNQSIHNIDLLRWMMGDRIDEVFAYTDQLKHDYLETEDIGLAVVRFSNGSYGLLEGTTNVYPQNLEETLYLFGSTGTAKAAGTSLNCIEEWMFGDGIDDADQVKRETCEDPANVYGFGHVPLYADMIEAIVNDRSPYVDAHAGRRALELVLAIYKSAKEGVPVKLPLSGFSTTDMVGRFGRSV